MRTEHELRDAFDALAERSPSPDLVLERLRHERPPASHRPRRVALVLAAVVAVVLALALPRMLSERTGVPADTRDRDSWNLTHRVDPPPGFVVSQQLVLAHRETTVLSPTTGAGRDTVGDCTVDVHGPGSEPLPERTAQDVPVDVQGQEGYYRDPPATGAPDGGLFWRHSEETWARANCHRSRQRSTDLAQRVAFTPVEVRLPFTLRSLPPDYQLLSVLPDGEAGAAVDVGVGLSRIGSTDVEDVLGVTVAPAESVDPARTPGEPGTLAGLPAVFHVGIQSLCAETQDQRVCVSAGNADEPEREPATSWPAGRREQLADLGERLQLSPDLADRSTWTGVDQALPR